jgi:hypothetical protein
MGGRLGDRFPAEGVEWWTTFMGKTAVSTLVGFNKHINYADIRGDLPKIQCPTLVVVTEESGLGSVELTRVLAGKDSRLGAPRAAGPLLPRRRDARRRVRSRDDRFHRAPPRISRLVARAAA